MVLRSTPPAWLAKDAPHGDVALSSRARVMRNLRGHRFPHHAAPDELKQILDKVLASASKSGEFEALKEISDSERDYLVGSRLSSPDFKWKAPGRALLLDPARACSVMVNEEDHLRLQAVTAGWSALSADGVAQQHLNALERNLQFARSDTFGYLAASPYNAGEGRRLSAMFHLIGLAQSKRLPSVLRALSARGLTARGLFGESSRAVGAFLQVSVTSSSRTEFIGACEYLIREERDARSEVGIALLEGRTAQALDFVNGSGLVSLSDALRVVAWFRWAATAGLKSFSHGPREVDYWLSTLELRGGGDDESAARQRGDFLRSCLQHRA